MTENTETHGEAPKKSWETKLRCVCGAGDFATRQELAAHVRAMTENTEALPRELREAAARASFYTAHPSELWEDVTLPERDDWMGRGLALLAALGVPALLEERDALRAENGRHRRLIERLTTRRVAR